MNVIREIQNVRSEIAIKTDAMFDELIRKLESGAETVERGRAENYETIYPITTNPAIFKGKRPTGVIFEGERVNVSKWKTVVEEIMRRCNADAEKHVALMNLRGKIAGRERILLSNDGTAMRSPIEIDKNLYIETHYDTETLLRILTTRILNAVGYDYSNIAVAVRNT
jgi:hypothetical protein